jgi:DUF917 family protein
MLTLSVNELGNICFIKETPNYCDAEQLGKLISANAYGLAGKAGFILSGNETNELLVKNTLTEYYKFSVLIRKAQQESADPIARTMAFWEGRKILR